MTIDWEEIIFWVVVQLMVIRIVAMIIWLIWPEYLIPFLLSYIIGLLGVYCKSWGPGPGGYWPR